MQNKIKTLVLDANGFGWKAIVATTVRGLLGIKAGAILPLGLHKNAFVKKLLLVRYYDALSYVNDWREAICDSPELEAIVHDINNLPDYLNCLRKIKDYELIIILHSAAGDSMTILSKTAHLFNRRKGKLVVFLGNEYALMNEKIDFINKVRGEYICSQLPIKVAKWLYDECKNSSILEMPHALNAKLYNETHKIRDIDVGFIGALYHKSIGDMERTNLIRYFQSNGDDLGLKCDIRIGNIPRNEWAEFLNKCKGIIGAESGTYFLDKRGTTISKVKEFSKRHPEVNFKDVYNKFFKNCKNYIFGKAISSRHFEPIGAKTCQILLEGYYNGILLPDKHYIPVKKDLSNIKEAVEKFKDPEFRNNIIEEAYSHVINGHTYSHRVQSLLNIIFDG